jgi:S-adenosylmethionine/arginine decarboxylase-like enzyme
MKNLTPMITRKRLVIEGICTEKIGSGDIKKYLAGLSKTLKMNILLKPMTHKSEKYGWAGWVHWDKSGCHFYAWDKPFHFFSADIYTCTDFKVKDAVAYTKKIFKAKEIVHRLF